MELDFMDRDGNLVFVDMPFGQKSDLKSGTVVDFDQNSQGSNPSGWQAESQAFSVRMLGA